MKMISVGKRAKV